MPSIEHDPRSIVITGVGLATSLGRDADETWAAIRAGRSGLGTIEAVESPLPEGSRGGQAVELPSDFEPNLPREVRYLRWVIAQSLQRAGTAPYPPDRRALILGTTLHGLRAGGRFLRSDDPGELRHFLSNAVSRHATEGLGIEGLSATNCSACSSGLGAIALGITLLESGSADMVIAGGYDAMSEYAWAGFNSLRLVAPRAVLPFSKHREGMMIGEGYGVVVLERSADASKRKAPILAHIEGWGESADAHHLTQPDPNGKGAASAILAAMNRANVEPSHISMIAAHATATPDNDAAECAGFRLAFGEALSTTPVVGFKSYLGHTLGGAGVVELILSAYALRDAWVPPCAGVSQDDVEFAGLTVAPPQGLAKRLTRTLNTSLGFGGANTCIVLGAAKTSLPTTMPARAAAPPPPEAWITGYGLVLPGFADIATLLAQLTGSSGPLVARDAVVHDEQLAQIINLRRMRRQSTYTKLSLASVALALRHAGLEGNADLLAHASAMLASTHGSSGFCSEYYTQIVRDGVASANPVLFAEGVPNAAAAHVSATFGVRGACQTIIGSRTAGLEALAFAAMRITSGASQTVIVAAGEETHTNVSRAYRHCKLSETNPDETNGEDFYLSPGSVALIVESSTSASARGTSPLAKIGAWSASSTSNSTLTGSHPSDPPRQVLEHLNSRHTILTSHNHTWLDRAETLAVHSINGATLHDPLHTRAGDLFSAGPLLSIVAAIAENNLSEWTSLCTDFTGKSIAVRIERGRPGE